MKKIIFPFFAFLLFCSASIAQVKKIDSKPFVLGVTDKIESLVLSESRTLNIYLPEGYSPDSAATYPVIYLLDGSADEDFIHVSGLVQYLSFPWINAVPKSIVVGIANVDRRRDFTSPSKNPEDLKACPTSGGSEKFIAFLEKEVQPYIQKNYKTNSEKTLIGESLGGLLATEILLKKPALFNNYIIISPSLWWDKESLLNDAKTMLDTNLKNPVKVYVSVGTEGKQMQNDAAKLAGILTSISDSDSKIKAFYVPMPDENHGTIMHRSVYKAFELLYKK
ncbi:MAG: Esterase [Bacteroidetes bacterium]|nr:Esterase [Bacteroidota bacterium]